MRQTQKERGTNHNIQFKLRHANAPHSRFVHALHRAWQNVVRLHELVELLGVDLERGALGFGERELDRQVLAVAVGGCTRV